MNNSAKNYNILLWKNKIWESKVSNTGDLAIILNTILKIKKYLPYVEVHMFSDDPEYVRAQYSVQAYPIREIFNPIKLYRLIKQMDLVILGGGTVLQDDYFIGIIPINLSIPFFATLLGKKAVCNAIGAGAENEVSFIGEKLSTFVLKRFKSVTVRDEESKELLDKWLKGGTPVTLTNDIAVDIPSIDFERIDKSLKEDGIDLDEKPTIAIAARKIFHHEKTLFYFLPSSLRTRLGLVHPLYKKRLKEFQVCLAEFCDYITKQYEVNIVFVPFYSSGGSVDSSNISTPRRLFTSADNEFAEETVQHVRNRRNVIILKKNYRPEEIIAIIDKCEALIGVPYHSVVFASSRNVPVIGINYVSKVQRYMKILGMEEYLIPAKIQKGVSLNLLKQKFDKLWTNREKITNHLEIKNKTLYELSNMNISVLEKVLNNG